MTATACAFIYAFLCIILSIWACKESAKNEEQKAQFEKRLEQEIRRTEYYKDLAYKVNFRQDLKKTEGDFTDEQRYFFN